MEDEDREFTIYFNSKTGFWESEREILWRVRRAHIHGMCWAITFFTCAFVVVIFFEWSRGAMIAGSLLCTIAAIITAFLSWDNLQLAKGKRGAHEPRKKES